MENENKRKKELIKKLDTLTEVEIHLANRLTKDGVSVVAVLELILNKREGRIDAEFHNWADLEDLDGTK